MFRSAIIFLIILFPAVTMATDVSAYELSNGMKIFVQEDHRAPVAVSQVWYKVGSGYEPVGITGISHVLEHMMFKGTETRGPGEFSRIIAENGGEENAFTGRDYTAYYQTMDASKLNISFELEADRMRNLNLDSKEFAKEIQVVMEERRSRYDDNPEALTYERFLAAANISTAYHHLPIGWMHDLENMTVEDLQAWYDQWYAPNNAILVVVGDVDPDEVYKLAKKYFGKLKPSELPVIKPQKEIAGLGQKNLVVKAPAQLPWMMMGYNVPSIKSAPNDDDPYVLAVIAGVLSDGSSSRLVKNVIRGQRVAVGASASYSPFDRLDTIFKLQGNPSQTHSVADLQEALLAELETLKETPVSIKELERVKTGLVAARVFDKDAISNEALEIGGLESVDLPWQLRDTYIDHISAVTPAQIQSVAREYFSEDNLTIAELKPLPIPGSEDNSNVEPHLVTDGDDSVQ